MQVVKFLFVFAAFFALMVFPAGSDANHSWGTYHWARTSNPFTLKVGNNVNSNWTSQFNTAVSDWNAS